MPVAVDEVSVFNDLGTGDASGENMGESIAKVDIDDEN
jgi:hypothetical protein